MSHVGEDLNPVGPVLAEVRDMGPVTVRDIAVGVGRSESTVRRVLRYLQATEMVESDNYQRRSRVWMAA